MSGFRNEKIDVYCVFRSDGQAYPIKVRLLDDDGARQEFAIHKYRQVDFEGSDITGVKDSSEGTVISYDCVVEVFGVERTIRLSFYKSRMRWILDILR